jgi:cell shape-determining protein MreD
MPIQGYIFGIGTLAITFGPVLALVARDRRAALWVRVWGSVALIGLAMIVASFLSLLSEAD